MTQLPSDSAVRRATHGDEFVEWTKAVDLLSRIAYAVECGNWQRGEGKGAHPKADDPPIPWDLDPWPEFEDDDD